MIILMRGVNHLHPYGYSFHCEKSLVHYKLISIFGGITIEMLLHVHFLRPVQSDD